MILDFEFFFFSISMGIALAMDAFSVSLANGLNEPHMSRGKMTKVAGVFSGFQALMPLIGFFLGALFYDAISAFDHWIAFGLLALIGANMLKEALSKEECCECCDQNADLSPKTMFVMAIATSIDALAVGISLAMAGDVNIFLAVALIGLITFLMSGLGVKIGSIFGSRFEKKAQAAGGIILVLLGLKILLEHLGVIV